MPSKKPSNETTPDASPIEAKSKPKTTRAKKAEPAPPPAVTKPKATSKAAVSKNGTAKVAPKVAAKPSAKAKAPVAEVKVASPKPAAKVASTKAPARRAAKAEDGPQDPYGRLVATFRPFTPTAKPAPKTKAPAKTKEPSETQSWAEDDLTVIAWRSKGETKSAETDVPADARKSRRRRGKDKPEEPAAPSVELQTIIAAAPTPPPPIPVKPAIPVPENAPQVVVRNGVPTLVRDHRVYPPIIFFGNPSDERRAKTVFDELKMAADSGVHIHSFLVQLPVDESAVDHTATFAGYLLSQAIEADPDAQVIFRIDFQAARGWEQRFPNATYKTADGEVGEPSVCDEDFWGVASECLRLFVRKLRMLDQADHLFGVHLERGEWFFPEGHGFDSSKAATKGFREWARHRYYNDEVTLRASWFDGTLTFDSIQVPPFAPQGVEHDRFIRSSRRQRRYVDYHLFLGDATVRRISELAYVAKEAAEGMILVGASYGYTFEWSHPASGHLALGKLLRTEEIDFIAGPPSYRNRQPGGTAPFPCPIDSFALNGKLYLSEEDFKTSLSTGHEPDDFNPALKTPQALESVHWRGAGAALAHGSGVEWMDLWGNGWLRTHSVWERAGHVQNALIDRMKAPLGEPDVAVFIDERALAYLVDSKAFDLLVQNVRESVLRAGVSAAFYLLSDLAHREKFPESRLYLFVNAWDIRPELRAAIKSRLQRDDKVLFWLYSAGLFDAGRESLERAREVTGIALKPQPFYSKAGTTILNRRHPLSEAFPDRSVIAGMKLEPSYFAIPENGTVLGEYTQTGLPSFVVKEFHEDPSARWTSVFLGEPVVNPALIRALAQMAGAHIWNFHEDVVHVRGPFCTVHCSGTGPRTITLPDKYSAYNLLTGDWAAMDSTSLRFVAIDGSTHVFLVGPRTEIEHLLNTSPEDMLRIEDLPPRESNIREDTSNFDVPIMRLDEWMEGGDQDDVADEWFLRPQQLLEDPQMESGQAEETEQVGRRRRRRKGRSRTGSDLPKAFGNEEVVTARVQADSAEDSFSMNILFRKRD
jgi:hypothetical protein